MQLCNCARLERTAPPADFNPNAGNYSQSGAQLAQVGINSPKFLDGFDLILLKRATIGGAGILLRLLRVAGSGNDG